MDAQTKARDVMVSIQPGLYEHYKGGRYEVISVAVHSETHEMLVVYRSLTDSQTWVRPLTMFAESIWAVGRFVPRFRRVG
jgi:hypothetical protein